MENETEKNEHYLQEINEKRHSYDQRSLMVVRRWQCWLPKRPFQRSY